MHLNLFDIILLAIFLGSVFWGSYRGFILSSISISSFLLTILLTIILIPFADEIVFEHINHGVFASLASATISYILSNFASKWISKRFTEIIKDRTGGMIDRIFGLWIGAFRGFVICFILFAIVGIISSNSYVGAKNSWQMFSNIDEKEYPHWLKRGYLYPFFQTSIVSTHDSLSGSFVESYLLNVKLPSSSKEEEGKKQETEDVVDPKKDEINNHDVIEEIHNGLMQIRQRAP